MLAARLGFPPGRLTGGARDVFLPEDFYCTPKLTGPSIFSYPRAGVPGYSTNQPTEYQLNNPANLVEYLDRKGKMVIAVFFQIFFFGVIFLPINSL